MEDRVAPDSEAVRFSRREQEDLRNRAVAGDIYARRLLVSEAMGLVHKAAIRYQPIPEREYQELVQIGVLSLQSCVDRWNPDTNAFSSFAFGRVRLALHRHYSKRKASREQQCEDVDSYASPHEDTESLFESRELLARLEVAICGLDNERQMAIVQARLEGRSIVEISESYGISPCRVRQIESKAIAQLRAAMAPDYPGGL